MQISPDALHLFFGWIVWVVLIAIIVAVYIATRGGKDDRAPIGKTYACAVCGRRGNHEHMVPVNRSGSVVWYCSKHVGSNL